jgi:hypothetical protein
VPALTDGAARLLVVLLTAGNVHDSTMFGQLLSALRVAHAGPGRPRTRQDYLIADRGLQLPGQPRVAARPRHRPTIPEKADQASHRCRKGPAGGRSPGFDRDRYARRNSVERGFCGSPEIVEGSLCRVSVERGGFVVDR